MSIKIVKDEKSVASLYDMDFPLPPEMYEKISSFLWDKVCTTCERVVTFKKKKFYIDNETPPPLVCITCHQVAFLERWNLIQDCYFPHNFEGEINEAHIHLLSIS